VARIAGRLRSLLRGLAWSVFSGGVFYLRAWRLAWQVSRRAPCFAEGEVLLVPGYRLQADEVPPAYARRLRRARRLWRPDRRLLLSGCAAGPDDRSEALAGFSFLRDLGLPSSARVTLDVRAWDTRQNLIEAHRRLLPEETLVIISNRWHLARCALLARQLGLRAKICAAERRWHGDAFAWIALCREAFALLCFCGREAATLSPKLILDTQR
jgi:vancomycin permeability regulator SanA